MLFKNMLSSASGCVVPPVAVGFSSWQMGADLHGSQWLTEQRPRKLAQVN